MALNKKSDIFYKVERGDILNDSKASHKTRKRAAH